MTQSIINFFSFCPGWLQVLIVSMIPIVELRGAIPWGTLALKLPALWVFFLAWFGNMIPAPIILKFVPVVLNWMRNTKHLKKIGDFFYNLGMKKTDKISRYKFWGLTLFIAIPLPGTGVWTGCLAASLMGMDFKRGLLSAALGAAIAGVVITALCTLGLIVVGA